MAAKNQSTGKLTGAQTAWLAGWVRWATCLPCGLEDVNLFFFSLFEVVCLDITGYMGNAKQPGTN